MSGNERLWYRAQTVLYLLAVLAVYGIAALPAGNRALPYLLDHFILTALMLGLLFSGWKDPQAVAASSLVVGIAARLLLLGVPAFTSHDLHRYLWDGAVVLRGIDPYRVPPAQAAPALGAAWLPVPDNPSWPTLYPPAALALFAFCARWGEGAGVLLWKLVVCVASSITLIVGYRLLRRRDALRWFALIAFSPLLVLEGGVGAHLDLCAVAALLVGLDAWERGRAGRAGACLALGGLLKFFPLFAVLPLLATARKDRSRALALVMGVTLGSGLGYGLACALGLAPLGSLLGFFQTWRFGSPLGFLPSSWRAMLFATGLFVCARAARGGDPLCSVTALLALVFFTSPVVFPWYLAPLAAMVAFSPSLWLLGWLTALPLTYEVLDRFDLTGRFEPAIWPLVAIVLSWSLGLLPERFRSWYASSRP